MDFLDPKGSKRSFVYEISEEDHYQTSGEEAVVFAYGAYASSPLTSSFFSLQITGICGSYLYSPDNQERNYSLERVFSGIQAEN